MKNSERFDACNEKKDLKGREAITTEAALKTQEELIQYLTPPQILQLLPDDKEGILLEALTLRYMEKYVLGDFNGFSLYCDQESSNLDFIERVNKGNLTTDDFENMKNFLVNHDHYGEFFNSEKEVSDFIEQYSH